MLCEWRNLYDVLLAVCVCPGLISSIYGVLSTNTYALISKPSQFYTATARRNPNQMEFIQILFEDDAVDPVATQRYANRQLRDWQMFVHFLFSVVFFLLLLFSLAITSENKWVMVKKIKKKTRRKPFHFSREPIFRCSTRTIDGFGEMMNWSEPIFHTGRVDRENVNRDRLKFDKSRSTRVLYVFCKPRKWLSAEYICIYMSLALKINGNRWPAKKCELDVVIMIAMRYMFCSPWNLFGGQ